MIRRAGTTATPLYAVSLVKNDASGRLPASAGPAPHLLRRPGVPRVHKKGSRKKNPLLVSKPKKTFLIFFILFPIDNNN